MSTYTGISLLIFHPEVYVDQYGCQDINSSSLPFELRARPIVGWIQLVLVIVSEVFIIDKILLNKK
jgi:hypothetical protein